MTTEDTQPLDNPATDASSLAARRVPTQSVPGALRFFGDLMEDEHVNGYRPIATEDGVVTLVNSRGSRWRVPAKTCVPVHQRIGHVSDLALDRRNQRTSALLMAAAYGAFGGRR